MASPSRRTRAWGCSWARSGPDRARGRQAQPWPSLATPCSNAHRQAHQRPVAHHLERQFVHASSGPPCCFPSTGGWSGRSSVYTVSPGRRPERVHAAGQHGLHHVTAPGFRLQHHMVQKNPVPPGGVEPTGAGRDARVERARSGPLRGFVPVGHGLQAVPGGSGWLRRARQRRPRGTRRKRPGPGPRCAWATGRWPGCAALRDGCRPQRPQHRPQGHQCQSGPASAEPTGPQSGAAGTEGGPG